MPKSLSFITTSKKKLLNEINEAGELVRQIYEGQYENIDLDQNSSEFMNLIGKLHNRLGKMLSESHLNASHLASCSKELNQHAGSLYNSAQSISGNMGTISQLSDEMEMAVASIASASEELNVNMNNVAKEADETTKNVVEVNDASQGLTQTISTIANSSEEARRMVEEASENSQSASERVSELGQSAKDINAVIEVISKISEQTQLLALNAKIEAAGAGAAGKGFAVVADEVKELAVQTSDITAGIAEKINAIQKAIQLTVKDIGQINKAFLEVNTTVTDIAAAVKQQSVSANDISGKIQNSSQRLEDVNENVSQACSAISEIATNIQGAEDLVKKTTEQMHAANSDCVSMRDESSKVYASAIECDSVSADLLMPLSQLEFKGVDHSDGERFFMKFSDIFDVQVPECNDQHIKIIYYINQIHHLVKKSAELEEIKSVLNQLAEFTVGHFAHEEELFQKYDFPDTIVHKAAHEKLLASVGEILQKIEKGEEMNLIEVLAFLRTWLIEHIMGMDMKYGDYLTSKGIKL
ncbi:MAG: bacteriohemerythrin [Planctomycetes bacterium]|nr:bacteriohemerythrin [Planctomycetota bacterium]